MVFPGVIFVFFPLIVFPSAGFTPWSKNSHERGKGKGGKGEEKEQTGIVSHGQFLTPKVIVFAIVLLSFVNPVCFPFFPANDCNHQKRSVATTYQAPSLCRICAITTTNNEKKRPKALNSRRMMEKSRTLDFKSLDTDHYYNQRYRVFVSLLSCFRVKAKNGSWGIMED